MCFSGRVASLIAAGLTLGALLAPTPAPAASDRTKVFALDASFYPAHMYLGGQVPTNHEVDHLIGSFHYSTFAELGRHPEHGWMQAALWQPKFTVTRPDGSRHRRTAVLTTAYVVSEYDSPAAAHAAVRDLYVVHQKWGRLGEGSDGRILYQKQDGFAIIAAAFSEGGYDIEDVTLVAPNTPHTYYRTIKASMLGQLVALDKIIVGLDSTPSLRSNSDRSSGRLRPALS